MTHDAIIEGIYDFERLTGGHPPKAVYLGHNDLKTLQASVNGFLLYRVSQLLPQRAEIHGVPIYEVDADDHFGVG